MTTMKDKHALAWANSRKAGLAKWTLMRGLLTFGVPMCLTYLLLGWLNGHFAQSLVTMVPACLLLGSLYGVATWHLQEWQYRRYVAKQGTPS